MTKNAHGGDIYSFAKRVGIKTSEVIDFSSNINQYKPRIKKDFNTLDISKYADPHYTKLKKALAKQYKIKPTQLTLFNGASAAIAYVLSDYHDKVTLYAPAYSEYTKYAKNITSINRFEALTQEPEKNSLVIFVNPATPDGKYYDLEKLFDIWQKQSCIVLVDESFLEFTTKPSAKAKLKSYDKLFILKSLTKFYACAGVRIAIMISNEKYVDKTLPLWNISSFDEAYIRAALKDKTFPKRALKKIAEDKQRLLYVLENSPLIEKIYPSDANFFLVKLKGMTAKQLQEQCDDASIMIRECENFDYLDAQHVRIAVRKKKDIKKLKKILHA